MHCRQAKARLAKLDSGPVAGGHPSTAMGSGTMENEEVQSNTVDCSLMANSGTAEQQDQVHTSLMSLAERRDYRTLLGST